eukprot:gene6793-12366_t
MKRKIYFIQTLALYVISFGLFDKEHSLRGATYWHLREQNGVMQVVPGEAKRELFESDPFFSLLIKANPPKIQYSLLNQSKNYHVAVAGVRINSSDQDATAVGSYNPGVHCGPPVYETPFDYLPGISKRKQHPLYPEPEVALIFKQNEFDEPNLVDIESGLKEAMIQGENKVVLFNQVGNFLRIKGDTYHSIECFRSALAIAPNNADVLLNLARVLHNLKYLDDAITLTQRSLDLQPADHNSWLQHFTMGEILKSRGDIEEAKVHFRNALDLNPSFIPAELHLRDLGYVHGTLNTNMYSLLLIFLLLSSIFPFVYFTVVGDDDSSKPKRRIKS